MGVKIEELTSLQQELLKIYSFSPSEEELKEIKHLLGVFFAKRMVKKVTQAADKKGITNDDLEGWVRGE